MTTRTKMNETVTVKCAVCNGPAVVRIVAADAFGTVLDATEVCGERDCLNAAGAMLTIGEPPTVEIKGRG